MGDSTVIKVPDFWPPIPCFEEDTKMDSELRESFKELKEINIRQETKIDDIRTSMGAVKENLIIHEGHDNVIQTDIRNRLTNIESKQEEQAAMKKSIISWIMGIVAAGLLGAGSIAWGVVKALAKSAP